MTSVMPKQAAPVVTAAMRTKAQDNIKKAKVQLVLHQPFFASIILKRKIDIKDEVQTAYVTASGHIVCGTAFTAGLTVPEVVFLLAHEAMHYAMLHHMRRSFRKQKPWNVSCDYVINDILSSSGVGKQIEGTLRKDNAKDFTAEQLYDEQQGGGGKGGDQYEPGNGWDDMSDDGLGDIDDAQIEDIKRELIQARTAAKAQGKMPAALEGLIDSIINPITPWFQILERFMMDMIKQGYSFRRPNKRYVVHDIYLPSYDKLPRMGTLVVQSDESGSISDKFLQHFAGHFNKMLDVCKPERVILLHTDTRVAKMEEFTVEDFPVKFKSYAGGGTNMEAGFDFLETEGIVPDVFVCLTDMYTDFTQAPDYPVVWLSTTKDAVAPYGETIYYEVTE